MYRSSSGRGELTQGKPGIVNTASTAGHYSRENPAARLTYAASGNVRRLTQTCFIGKDVCEEAVSFGSMRKGDVVWPDTEVGRRVSVRCQYAYAYAYALPVFVSRDCILADVNNSSAAAWSPWRFGDMDICPDPPFTRRVQELYHRLVIICIIGFIVGSDVRFQIIYTLVTRFQQISKILYANSTHRS